MCLIVPDEMANGVGGFVVELADVLGPVLPPGFVRATLRRVRVNPNVSSAEVGFARHKADPATPWSRDHRLADAIAGFVAPDSGS